MADATPAPADAGASSNAATPVADAALVNSAANAAAPVTTEGIDVGTNMAVPAAIAAGAVNDDGTMKVGKDGEPIPVGNEAQQKVAKTIADSFNNPEDHVGLNAELKDIISKGQTQSAAGPKPVELAPVEVVEPTPNNVSAKAEVKGKGTVVPPSQNQ